MKYLIIFGVLVWLFLIIFMLWVINGIKKIYKSQTSQKDLGYKTTPHPALFTESLSSGKCLDDKGESDLGC